MGIFSKIISKNEKKIFLENQNMNKVKLENEAENIEPIYNENEIDIFKPSQILIELMKDMTKVEYLTEEVSLLNSLTYNSNPKRSGFIKVIDSLNKKLMEYQNTIVTREMILDILDKIKNLSHSNIEIKFRDFEKFNQDMKIINEEFFILTEINKKIEEIYDDIEIKSIYLDYEENNKFINEILDEMNEFIINQNKLSDEIIKFSETIVALKQKYKYSIDWNGKKNHMVALGARLNAKRTDSINIEQKLKEKISELYPEITKLHFKFIDKCYYLSVLIKEKLENFEEKSAKDSKIYKFHEILSEYIGEID